MGIYTADNWFDEISPFTLGITQFFGYKVNGGTAYEYIEMLHADIIINTKYFQFSTLIPTPQNHYDLASVVLHERGDGPLPAR